MSTEISVPEPHESDEPRGLRQLAWFAQKVSESGLYTRSTRTGQVNLTPAEAFMVIQEGLSMGLRPMQALAEISVIESNGRKTTIASYKAIAARIQADPRVESFEWSGDETYSEITVKRRDRAAVDSVRVDLAQLRAIDEITAKRHAGHLEDWLFSRALRRLAKRGYSDMILGIYVGGDPEIDETRVLDVSAVARDTGHASASDFGLHADCGGRLELHSNTRTGGAFLLCSQCHATFPPPQEVREAVRGTPEHLTLAALNDAKERAAATGWREMPSASEVLETVEPDPVHSSADVTPPPSEESAVQSETGGGAHTEAGLGSGDASHQGAIPPEPDSTDTIDESPSEAADTAGEPSRLAESAASSPSSPRDQLLQFLRDNRMAEGQRHTAIRDALLAAGWDGRKGINETVNTMSDDHVASLLQAFASPGFGELA